MVVLSSGGQLAELAETWGATHVALPEVPMPRAAIGSVSIPPLMVLERVGLFPGAQQYVADAVEQLNRRRDKLILDGTPAHVLARQLARTIPVAYGGGDPGEAAAHCFKCPVPENPKAPTLPTRHPGVCHHANC